MAGVNKVIIVGNLGSDPELRYTASGQAVANFTVATNESFTDKNGVRQDRTEWHRIVVWGKTAEICGEYLQKGRQVYLEGKLQTRQWDDKEGTKRYTTEVVAQTVQFLGARGGDAGDVASGHAGHPANNSGPRPPAADGSSPAPRSAQPNRPAAAPQRPQGAQGGEKNFDFGPPPMSDDDIPF